jgi:ankyrin repeat protein
MTKLEAINAYDENGMTPLLYAVFSGDLIGVRELLEQGADCNKPQRDDPTATPLWHAEEDFGLVEIAKVLRASGAH